LKIEILEKIYEGFCFQEKFFEWKGQRSLVLLERVYRLQILSLFEKIKKGVRLTVFSSGLRKVFFVSRKKVLGN